MDFIELLKKRRSHYLLSEDVVVSEEVLCESLRQLLLYLPSAYNSQSTRLVLLLGDAHKRLWNAVCDKIAMLVTPEAFAKSRAKIERCFASGLGTVLFFEDEAVVDGLRREYPLYADSFDIYSEHTSAMHQIAVWLLLVENGYGASLQHYDALLKNDINKMFGLPATWRLIGQMPFGKALDVPGEKSVVSLDERFRVVR
ncbi:MAG: nitroreductase family protein [Bacteroidaceae bacterium]|nr:nitroreductase family protein [Bacteroidaceae bacterium]